MRNRRPERTIHLSTETIINLPESRSDTDVWYDDEVPYLAYRAAGERGRARFLVILGRRETRGAVLSGENVGRHWNIDASSPEEARQKARDMEPKLKEWRGQGRIVRAKRQAKTVDDLMAPKSPSENPNYDSLLSVLMDAYNQAANGKGSERHGEGLNFEDQDMLGIMDNVGEGFGLGQAMKKIVESGRKKNKVLARAELLGAIVYLAGTILWKDTK